MKADHDHTWVFEVKGASTIEVFDEIQNKLSNYERTGNSISFRDGEYFVDARIYTAFEGLSVAVGSYCFPKDVVFVEQRPDDRLIMLRGTKQQLRYIDDGERIIVENKPSTGLYMFNSRQLTETFIPRGQRLDVMAVRFNLDFFKANSHGKLKELAEHLLNDEEAFFYETLTYTMERNLNRVFEAQDLDFGLAGFTVANALELTTLFLIELYKRRDDFGVQLKPYDYQQLTLVKQYLLSNLHNSPNARELSREFGMSEARLRANFKSLYGYPPHQFVMRHRIENAKRLLANPEMSMSEIAGQLGFANSNHFSKAFNKSTGLTPKAFRKEKLLNFGQHLLMD